MGMAVKEASQGRCPAFACFEYALGSEHYHRLGGVCAIVGAANPTAAEHAMMPSWTNARQLKNHAALKKRRKVSIRALHNCLDAQPVTVVDASLNPSNDAILDKRFGYACSDEKNWISRDLSWNKYPEVFVNSRTDTDFDVFSRYSQLYARNVLPRCSSNSPQHANSSRFGTTQHPDLDVFEKYSHLYAKSTTTQSPTTSLDTVHTSIVRNAQTIYNESQTQYFFRMKVISCFQISLLHAYALLLMFIFLDRLLWLFKDS
ncbi:hypothetical protein Tco_0620611 [Tanacetum coccineum]